MKCSKCGSENIQFQVVNEAKMQRHSTLYWIFIGWWWRPICYMCFGIFAFIFRKGRNIKNKAVTYAVCADCGNKWKVKS